MINTDDDDDDNNNNKNLSGSPLNTASRQEALQLHRSCSMCLWCCV